MVARSRRVVSRSANSHALAVGWVGLCTLGMLAYWIFEKSIG